MNVARIEGLSIATHWGVRLTLCVGPGAALVQQLKVPKKLPKACPLGAAPPPPSYQQVQRE
eukprot:5061245-Pyramimonas_sp.AAC.1